jgi:translation initiation factor IF-3
MNRMIRIPQIRLIGADGEQLGIFQTDKALSMAQDQGLDLVEISPNAKPPVCKIMDYGKYKYQQQKKQHENKKHQVKIQVKEVKVRPNIDDHDLMVKIKHVRRFLEGNDKAKVSVQFRGRENLHVDRGEQVVDKIIEEVKDLGEAESRPKKEGKTLSVILAPLG